MNKTIYINFDAPQHTDAGSFALFVVERHEEFKSLLTDKESASFAMYHGGSHCFSFRAGQDEAVSILRIFKEKYLEKKPHAVTITLDYFIYELETQGYGENGDLKTLHLRKFISISDKMKLIWLDLCQQALKKHPDLIDQKNLSEAILSNFNGQSLYSYERKDEMACHAYVENNTLNIAYHDISLRKPIPIDSETFTSADVDVLFEEASSSKIYYINKDFLLVYLALQLTKTVEAGMPFEIYYYDFIEAHDLGESNKAKMNKNFFLKA